MEISFLKLTNASYKIIEFFPESDPIKNRAKDKALAIMENPTKEDIDILLGYFWIAKEQNWLSSINYFIISEEYEKLRTSVIPAKAGIQTSTQAQNLDSRFRGNDKRENGNDKRGDGNDISGRQKKILEFLQKNEMAQVMDLQKILPSITKRTIRRDLDELIEAGRIVRVGEFNKSIYMIGQDGTK